MPSYTFQCETCLEEVDIIRSMAESDNPPTTEEFKHKSECTESKYRKIIRHAPKKAYAAGWGSDRKGRYNSRGGWG